MVDPETAEQRFARVKIPEGMPRFVEVGKRGLFVPLERVIAHFLPWLFPQMEIAERAVFRVTRDADFEVSDEADDLLEAVELELRRRRFGDGVRLEVSSSASKAMVERLKAGLGVGNDQVYTVSGLLDLSEVNQISSLDRPELKDEPWVPIVPPRFANASSASEMFAEIARGDLLVQQPYESFKGTFEAFVQQAARDPDVIAIKATVYRTSDESPLVPALIEASEEGKQSVCLVEMKARGDERRNIEWSRALERAGVHVVYGFANLKIHVKATLIVRREGEDAPPLRPRRHRQLSRLERPHVRGLRALHGRRGHRRRRGRPLQLPDRIRQAAGVPQGNRRPLRAALPPDRGDPQGREGRSAGKPGADPDQGQRAHDPAIIDELYAASRPESRST